jgi:hypothetical protein
MRNKTRFLRMKIYKEWMTAPIERRSLNIEALVRYRAA